MVIGHQTIGTGAEGVIVNHGWFGGQAFEPMLPYLDTETFTYAFMDYRGYGASQAMEGDHTMKEIAGDVAALAEHFGWDRFHMIGHSMGGMALCRVATDAPERIKSAVALNPVPASGVPLDEGSWELFSGAADARDNRRMILDMTTGNRLCGKWLDAVMESSIRTSDREAFRDYLTAWVKTDFAEESRGIEIPMKVIVGEHDPGLNADVMRETYLAWYPRAELEVVANAGHYPMMETPVYLASTMESFMRRFI